MNKVQKICVLIPSDLYRWLRRRIFHEAEAGRRTSQSKEISRALLAYRAEVDAPEKLKLLDWTPEKRDVPQE